MTDYLPLLSRAIDGLEKNTGESRRALYERARAALVNQLRSAEPPLDESEITRERLALEEAIRKVESQAIKHALLNEVTPVSPVGEIKSSLRDRALRNFREKMADVEDESAIAGASAYEGHKRAPERRTVQPYVKMGEIAEYEFPPPASKSELAPQAIDKGRFVSERKPGKIERTKSPPARSAEDDDIDLQLPRDYGRVVKIIVVLLLLSVAAALGFWKRETISSMIADLRGTSRQVTKLQGAQRVTPKIADRITPSSENGLQRPATAPVAAAAQKVVLYEEDPSNPQGQRFVGSAIWRTERASPGSGIAPELAVRADVEIPEKHMRMTWLIKRDTAQESPSSHTIEVMFTLPPDFPEGGIGNLSIILMKQSEQARGMQLAGLSVKVTNGYFLIVLSAADVDKQRNVQLLKERDWFDIPIVYSNGKRAILALEKGPPGVRAFEEAFRAWGE